MKPSASFDQFAGWCAILTGISGVLYSIAFIILRNVLLSGLFLALGGLLSSAALLALYLRLRKTGTTFALWATLLALAGALGATTHGGYDLANALNPNGPVPSDLPNPIDPRGLLTFGLTGLAMFLIAWLAGRTVGFPRSFSYLGYLLAVLLVILYLGRLIILNPASPVIAGPALLAGFIVNPAWYLWLGFILRANLGSGPADY